MGEFLARMILIAVTRAGSYDPERALPFIEEQISRRELFFAREFLEWVHRDVANRQFGHRNFDSRYFEFQDHCAKLPLEARI